MRILVTVVHLLARLLGLVQILMGLGIWLGWLPDAVTAHIALGSAFVIVLWILSLIALFVLSTRAVALFTLLWGGLVLWFGMAQTTLLVGPAHWTIRVAHLVVGMAAIGLAERLGKATRLHLTVPR